MTCTFNVVLARDLFPDCTGFLPGAEFLLGVADATTFGIWERRIFNRFQQPPVLRKMNFKRHMSEKNSCTWGTSDGIVSRNGIWVRRGNIFKVVEYSWDWESMCRFHERVRVYNMAKRTS